MDDKFNESSANSFDEYYANEINDPVESEFFDKYDDAYDVRIEDLKLEIEDMYELSFFDVQVENPNDVNEDLISEMESSNTAQSLNSIKMNKKIDKQQSKIMSISGINPDIDNNIDKELEFLSQDIGNIEFEYEVDDSEDLVSKKDILNTFIQKLPYFHIGNWLEIAEKLDAAKSLGKVIPTKIYKIAAVKFLINYGKEFNLLLAKEGSILYIYNGRFWDKIDENFVKLFLSMACIKLGIPKCEAFDTKFAKELFEQLVGNGFFKKMNYLDVTLINLQNGTLEIGLGGIKLLPFNPYDFLTYQLDFTFELRSSNYEWIDFVNDVLPDKDTQKTLQQSLGYLFIQGLKLEKMIFLFGTGSNGKSVIYEVLNGLIGDDLITHHPLEILTNPKSYHRTDLANKLINYGSDIKLDKINPAELKVLASGEKTQVRQIYQAPFIMSRYAKFIFNINTIDNANVESTIGFFRRMIFIPFDTTIAPEKQDKFLHHRILMNKAGVLNWILEGARQVLQNQAIFMSQKCYDFLDNFKKESNLAIRFIEDERLIQSNSNNIDFQVMYNKFLDFCKRQGERPLTQRIFNKELKKINISFERKNHGYVWNATFLK